MGCPGPKPKSSTVSEVHHAAERSFCCRRFGCYKIQTQYPNSVNIPKLSPVKKIQVGFI